MPTDASPHRATLLRIAHRAMREKGLLPEFSAEVIHELEKIEAPARADGKATRDLRKLLWCSIDNDDSRDLDQLTVAEALPGGRIKIMVAIADVSALVKLGSAIDDHARQNTCTVYTPAMIFSMLPEKLSTDFTSLNYAEDRLAHVVEMTLAPDSTLEASDIYRAVVHNHARLAYPAVAAWLEGGRMPQAIADVPGLAENLRLQDRAAQGLMKLRQANGALGLETLQGKPVFDGDQLNAIGFDEKNRAKQIIEDFMIAANGVTARFLAAHNLPSLRRVVHTPKRWERIVAIAQEHGYRLPDEPDPRALDEFLDREKANEPLQFPDLSLSIVKLLGSGEYAAEFPGDPETGHFGLAVKSYTHSTAPNRRFPDLVTQRLLKAALDGKPSPYTRQDMEFLARHCTEQEDDAKKIERQVEKSAAALLLQGQIGERYEAIVTGAADKGTWVRLLKMPVEGKLVQGFAGVDVGDRLRVQLVETDVERGFIDFRRV